MSDAIERLRRASQNEQTSIALNDLLRTTEAERDALKARLDKLCDAAESLSEDNLKLKERLAEAERALDIADQAICERLSGLSGDPLQPVADAICAYWASRATHSASPAPCTCPSGGAWADLNQAHLPGCPRGNLDTASTAGACLCPSSLGGPHPGCPVHGRAVCDL